MCFCGQGSNVSVVLVVEETSQSSRGQRLRGMIKELDSQMVNEEQAECYRGYRLLLYTVQQAHGCAGE